MTKKFYISGNKNDGDFAPEYDRFQRIEKLNALLSLGWVIKTLGAENGASYFLLEKDQG